MTKSLTIEQVIALYGKEIKENPKFENQVYAIYDYLFDKGYTITAQILDEQIRLIGSFDTDEDVYPPDKVWVDIFPTHLRMIFK